ncbi:MAG: DUF6985 domain-containing protein [Bacillota bacterium]
MIIQDEVFGTLEYKVNWERPYEINVFGRKEDVILSIEGEEDEELEDGQRKSFLEFIKNLDAIIFDAEYKLYEYYINNYLEFSEEVWGRKAPYIKSKEELGNFVKPYMIRFPYTFGRDIKVFGILFDCPWDDEAGVAVKFVNDKIEVGKDDILI